MIINPYKNLCRLLVDGKCLASRSHTGQTYDKETIIHCLNGNPLCSDTVCNDLTTRFGKMATLTEDLCDMAAVPPPVPALPPRNPLPIDLNTDLRGFGNLRQGAKDTLIDRFLRWTFRRPERPLRRTLSQGQWLPMQPVLSRGEHPLGAGGMGIVHLWACVDDGNRIKDRVIVKQVIPGSLRFQYPNLWRNGEIGGEPRESMLSNAVSRLMALTTPGDEKFVTECLGYGDMQSPYLYDANGRPIVGNEYAIPPRPLIYNLPGYKLYFEYCAYGELREAIFRQRVADEPFHEGFIWMTFEALAKCAEAMERCNIVHADITTANSESSLMTFP
ncbi:hypothetical protein E4T39_01580 [Aureobasidium subglaciale]|nr:hypothetical protein E4T39_01580 [Aureobasidium subglaciale]